MPENELSSTPERAVPMLVGRRIKEARTAQGMTQTELAGAVGLYLGRTWSHQAVSAAEKGARDFTALEILALGEILDRAPGWFLTPDEDEPPLATPGFASIDPRDVWARLTRDRGGDRARIEDVSEKLLAIQDELLALHEAIANARSRENQT